MRNLLNHTLRLFFFISMFFLLDTLFFSLSVMADTGREVQEISGSLEDEGGTFYTLGKLRKGETIYAYLSNTGGNLDPLLGIIKTSDIPRLRYDKTLELVLGSKDNIIDAFTSFASDTFIVWNDDGGTGYDARLKYDVPADGDYSLFIGSMISSQSIVEYMPAYTFGSYRLLLGKNAPEVFTGKAEPTTDSLAKIYSHATRPIHLQQLDIELTSEKLFTYRQVRKLNAGDTLYVHLTSSNNQPLPQLFLNDFGGKPLIFGKLDGSKQAATIVYNSKESLSGLNIALDGSSITDLSGVGQYVLSAGINAPEALEGATSLRGPAVFKSSNQVKIGFSIDQIVEVDQQSETFTIVGSLHMIWQEPALAFSPDKCNCRVKMMDIAGLKALALKNDIPIPTVTIFNQQGKRWSGDQDVFLDPSGLITVTDRFTVKLQAPDFDFTIFPFDKQTFHVKIDLNVPTAVFYFEQIENPSSPLGDQLGEEEWSVISHNQEVTEVPYGRGFTNSRFTTTLKMKRHLNYYSFRIIIPLALIICVSWVIFFLKDYSKQLDVASGNLLVFVAFNFTMSKDLPRLGYLTFLDRMIITSFCCAAMVVLISVCQKRLEAKGRLELASHIDKVVLISYPLIYITLMGVGYYLFALRL